MSPRRSAFLLLLTAALSLETSAEESDSSCESGIEIDKNRCDLTTCPSRCGLHGTSYLLSENKCCAHVGISASLLAFEKDDEWIPRLEEYNSCTGASVRLEYLEAGEDGMAEALVRDVGSADRAGSSDSGEGIYDAYIVQAPWIPPVVDGLQSLTPFIRENARYVNYQDINPASRSAVSFNGTVRALPLDTDYIAIGWREDVFVKHGLPPEPPRTIDELVELSERLNGLDHNDDGEPDWGFCLTPQTNYFYAFVAPIFQTNLRECHSIGNEMKCNGAHTGQNLFFDAETFEPLIRNPGFKHALKLYHRLIQSSNCQTQTPLGQKCDRKTAFPTGRCAGVVSMPGTLTNMLKEDGKYAPRPRIGDDGTVLWKPGMDLGEGRYWGRRADFPGSKRVVSWTAPGTPLVKCDSDACPLATDDDSVNRSPYFSEGGESYALNGRQSKPTATKVMWDLFTWLSELPVTMLPLSGQYRRSHLMDDQAEVLRNASWPQVMVDDLFDVLGRYFRDEDEGGNPAQDLLLVGFDDYMDALDEELHDKLLLADVNDGGLFDLNDPSRSVDPATDAATFDERYERFINAVEAAYDAITTETSGHRMGQLQRWRSSLNLPWRSDEELCVRLLEIGDFDHFDALDCASIVDLEELCQTHEERAEEYKPETCSAFNDNAIVAVIAVSSVLGAAILAFLTWFFVNRYKKYRRITLAHEQLMEENLDEAMRAVRSLEFPLHLLRGSDFVAMSSLQRHEIVRDEHKLTVMDALSDVDAFIVGGKPVVFFSHQWTSFDAPDPTGVQFETMRSSLKEIASRRGWDPNLKDVYVWVDYSCIPQRNHTTQMLAIRSLAAYASGASAFIVVAPTCDHSDTGGACDAESYQMRMWCRAEQICHSMRNGTDSMYLATSTSMPLTKIDDSWFHQSLRVFNGDLTCCRLQHKGMAACDRQSLVVPLLGLFGELYRAAVEGDKIQGEAAASVRAFLAEIESNQDEIFPRTFERVKWTKKKGVTTETVLLFGDLIERMKARIDRGGDVQLDEFETNTASTQSTKATEVPFSRHGSLDPDPSKDDEPKRGGSKFLRHGSDNTDEANGPTNGGQGSVGHGTKGCSESTGSGVGDLDDFVEHSNDEKV